MSPDNLNGIRPSVRETIIDLLATWGALADPQLSPLLESILRRSSPVETLVQVRERAGDLLPADLREEIDAALTVLRSGGTASAPSFRARLARLVELAGEGLTPALESARRQVLGLLEERWSALDDKPLVAALEALWAGAEASTVTGRVAALGRLQDAIAALREAGSSGGGQGAGSAPRSQAGGPAALADAKRLETRLLSVMEGVERSAGTSARATGAAGGVSDRLLTALGRLDPDLLRAGDGPEAESLLRLWEEEILPGLAGRTERARQQAEGRSALAGTLAALVPDAPGGQEAATHAATAKAQAPAGGPAFYEAVGRALERLAEAERSSAKAIEASSGRLKGAVEELQGILHNGAAHLPTELVVESRLLLEQASGALHARRREEIEAHTEAIRRRIEDARRLTEARRATTQKRDELQRQELLAGIRKLGPIAPRRPARALVQLEASLGRQGRGVDPEGARQALDRIMIEIEQGLRLPAARTLAAARSWLKRRGQGATRGDAPAAGLSAASEALAAALSGDDLEAIHHQSVIVRDLLRRASPWQRPALRRAAAGAAILLVAGLLAGWTLFQRRAHLVRLDLPGPWSTVWVVRDGHLVEKHDRRGTESRPEFRLPPGQYELYVDARYTGRRFSVPGESMVQDIIPPRPSESAGSTGADDDHNQPR